jgi:hypothetical protein
VRHHPETKTSLKNKSTGERQLNFDEAVYVIRDEYIDVYHPYSDDYHGRISFLDTRSGRVHRTTLMQNIYTLTCPCRYLKECPHERSINECEATTDD